MKRHTGFLFFLIFVTCFAVAFGFCQKNERKFPNPPTGPAAWWPLDEGKGSVVHDALGGGRTGTIYGAKWKQESGFWSLWFNGVEDCVVIGSDEKSLPPADAFTVSAWINPEDPAKAGSVAGWTWRNPFGIWIEHTQLRTMANIETENTITDAPPGLAASRWYHVLVSFDGQHIRQYVDGRLRRDRDFFNPKKLNLGIRSDSKNWPNWNFLIGIGDRLGRFQPFRGRIRDVKVWHRSLSGEEAAGEYQIKAKDFSESRFERRPLGKIYFCPRKNISIGGPSSQWEGIPAVSLGEENVYNTVSLGIERQEAGPLSWNGPKDLSGQAQFAHDDKHVFVRLSITDDVHVAYPGEGMWKGDSVQIAFDTLNDKSSNYGSDDYEYGVALVQGEVNTVCWAKARGTRSDSISCRVTREKGVTNYELTIPYESLYPFDPQNGILGFSFIVNDNDGPNRKGWLQLTPGIGDGKNPSAFASLLFTDRDWGFSFDRDRLDRVQATEDVLIRLTVAATKYVGDARLRLAVKAPSQKTVLSRNVSQAIQPGQTIISWAIKSGILSPGAYHVEGTIESGEVKETKKTDLTVVSKENVLRELRSRLKEVRRNQKTLAERSAALESSRKGSSSYSAATAAVMEVFLPRISQTLEEKDPEWKAIELVSEQLKELEAILNEDQPTLVVPAYISGSAKVQGGSYLGNVRVGDQVIDNYPIIFQGFTLFSRQHHQLGLLRRCGFNLVQADAVSFFVFPTEDKVNDQYVDGIRKLLDDAGDQGVAVDFMLAPHYYPEWMYQKHPKLREWGEFYSDAPENRAFLKKYIDYIIPRIRDSKGLISICLANEPGFPDAGARACPASQAKWRQWLKSRHGSIEKLNAVYGSTYASFDEVKPPTKEAGGPARQDWSWFLQEDFTDWHRFLADSVHQVAPAIPVHTKFLIDWILLEPDRDVVRLPELFSKVTDINGHDEWGTIWSSFCSDLQKSVADKPIFNSENHLIADHYEGYVSPNAIRSALWRQVLHGLCASAIWAWDWYNPADKPGTALFTGNIMTRPACLMAASKTAMDMMRLSPEITLLQNQKPDIYLLWSPSDITYQPQITSLILKTYEAAHLLGRRIGLVTEQQLENGIDISGRAILVPGTVYLSGKAFSKLKDCRDKNQMDLVYVGNVSLSRDEYGQPRSEALRPTLRVNDGLTTRAMWKKLYAQYPPSIQLLEDDQPAWNIEYRTAQSKQGLFVLLLNHDNRARNVRIVGGNVPHRLIDRITEMPMENPIPLEPQGTRLVKIERN